MLVILDVEAGVLAKVFPYTLIEAQSPEMVSRFLDWRSRRRWRNEILFAASWKAAKGEHAIDLLLRSRRRAMALREPASSPYQ
jgi:hypothetical protein